MDLRVAALDIETYGACTHTHDGRPLPAQTVFEPHRSIATDRVHPSDLILTASLTFPTRDPRVWPEFGPQPTAWCAAYLAMLEPARTQVFHLWKETHRLRLRRWLFHLDTIILHHGTFDIAYLRHLPDFRFALDGSHTLIDLSVVNYLHDETRPERSLKSLGFVLRTHRYVTEHTLKHRRFPNPLWEGPDGESLSNYNGQDSHNTLVSVAELARWTLRDWPDTDKLSLTCINDFSNRIWIALLMTECGVSMDRDGLALLEQDQLAAAHNATLAADSYFNLRLEGEGSVASKDNFLHEAATAAGVLDHPLLELTPKQQKISFKEGNRNLIRENLAPSHDLHRALDVIDRHQHAQKLVGSYTFPLLRHRKNHYLDRSSCLLPPHGPLPPSHDLSPLTEVVSPPSGSCISASSSATPTTSNPDSGRPASSLRNGARPSTVSPSTQEGRSRGSWRVHPTYQEGRSRGSWRVHPTWFVTPGRQKDDSGSEGGTIQGRITAKGPAVQTFPPEIDRFLVSRWGECGVLLSMDLSQIELRVAALLSGDLHLLAAYQRDGDLHGERAAQIWGPEILDDPNFRRTYRDAAKHVNFGDLFLAGPDTLQFTVLRMTGQHHPITLFEQIVRDRPIQRPGLTQWQGEEIAFAREHLHCRPLPLTGQTRWVRGGRKDPRSEIVNFPFQTTAGNTLLHIQADLLPFFRSQGSRSPWSHMTMNRYDAICFDVKRTHETHLRDWIESSVRSVETEGYWANLQDHYGNSVPLKYEVSS